MKKLTLVETPDPKAAGPSVFPIQGLLPFSLLIYTDIIGAQTKSILLYKA